VQRFAFNIFDKAKDVTRCSHELYMHTVHEWKVTLNKTGTEAAVFKYEHVACFPTRRIHN